MILRNLDSVVASVLGVGASLQMASTTPANGGWESLLAYLPTVLGPALVVVANRLLAARAAKLKARASVLEAQAKAELEDADKVNDDSAKQKQLEAVELKAEADALVSVIKKVDE